MGNIDYVVTYVDSSKPIWRRQYEEACSKVNRRADLNSNRYRDWDTLLYIMRGIDCYMPFIRNVYVVVSDESQVPSWLTGVKVITHRGIIPVKYLPTFNSTCIELFLYRIPGLSERFIYGNDDMIPIDELTEEDFYGKYPKLLWKERFYHDEMNMYRHHLHNGDNLARYLSGHCERNDIYIKTGHNLNPMLKSTWEYLWERGFRTLESSISKFRQYNNINQDLCAFYQIHSGQVEESERRTRYMEFEDMGKVDDFIRNTDAQLICLNDSKSKDYERDREIVEKALEYRLPNKSRFEI